MNFGRFDVESTVKILSNKDGIKGKKAEIIDVTGNGWHTVDYKGELYKYRTNQLSLSKPSPVNIYQPFKKPKARAPPVPPNKPKARAPPVPPNKPKARAHAPPVPPNKPKARARAPPVPPNKPKARARAPPLPPNKPRNSELVRKLSNEFDKLKKEVRQLRNEISESRTDTRVGRKPKTPFLTRVYRSISGKKKKRRSPVHRKATVKDFPPSVQKEITSPLDILDEMSSKPLVSNLANVARKRGGYNGKQLKKTERQQRKSKKKQKSPATDFLKQIQTKPKLKNSKSVNESHRDSFKSTQLTHKPLAGLGFLDQIKVGKNLKNVEKTTQPKKSNNKSQLEEAVLKRRQYIADTPEDDDEDDGEWEFGTRRKFSKTKKLKTKRTKRKYGKSKKRK